VDLDHEKRLAGLLRSAVAAGELESAHDVARGGLAIALAQCAIAGARRVGAEVTLTDRIRPEALLFGESTGRVIATSARPEALLASARAAGVPAQRIGSTGGERLRIGGGQGAPWIDAALADLHSIWSRSLPRRLEAA
jgi:phosphoribosylformylglycinamidine synthase